MPPNPLYYGAQVADLIRDRGRIEAQRAGTRGATLASAFQAAPRALAGFVQARDAQRLAAQAEAERAEDRQWQGQQRKRTMADWSRQDAITDAARMVPLGPDGQPDYGQIATEVGLIDPMAAAPYRQLAEADIATAKRVAQEKAETIAKELRGTKDQTTWDAALKRLETKGIRGVPRVFDVGTRDSSVAEALSFGEWLRTQTTETPKTREIKVANPDGTETIQVVEDRPGQTFTSTPAKPNVTFGQPEIAMVGTKRDYIVKGVRPDGTWAWYLPNSDTPFTGRVQPLEEKPAGEKDPLYARDRQEYADYVRVHDKQQEGRTQPGINPATGQPSALVAPVPMVYERPETFEVWRVRAKGRAPGGAPVRARTPLLPPRRLPGRERRAAILERRGAVRPGAPSAPLGPAPANAAPMSQRPTAPVTAPSTPTVQRPTPSASTTRPNVAIGSDVMYQGKRYRVKAIGADGQAELELVQ